MTTSGVSINGGSVNQLTLDLDALLVVTPFHHFGITIGPIAGIPLTGKTSSTTSVSGIGAAGGVSTTTSADISMWYVALALGVLGYF